MSTVLYLKIEQKIEVHHNQILLKDIAKMECTKQEYLNRLKKEKILSAQPGKEQRFIVSVLSIIEKIHEIYPDLEVQNLGETDFLVHYIAGRESCGIIWVKVTLIALITFLGSAFSIMTFQEDVSVSTLFDKIYISVLGTKPDGIKILEISYAIGLASGITLFFNHIGKSYFTKDPTPISVEMKEYEKQVNQTLIQENARRGNEIDVD
ncbi:MAG: stage V sporulation protein AA [Lachnospiraceae bacterium]